MREIRFRGKRTDNGEWVYGYYCKVENMYIIIPSFQDSNTNVQPFLDFAEDMPDVISGWFAVDPETVGQFVCKDKHGKDVFEGSRIKRVNYTDGPQQKETTGREGIIVWHHGFLQWNLKIGTGNLYIMEDLADSEIFEDGIEVIGE